MGRRSFWNEEKRLNRQKRKKRPPLRSDQPQPQHGPPPEAEGAKNAHRSREQHALQLMENGRLQEAEAIYGGLVEEGSRNPVVFNNLARICMMRGGRIQDMELLLKQVLAIKPDDLVALCNLGNIYLETDNLPAAMDAYKRSLAINPNDQEVLSNLGILFLKQGDLQGATIFYRRAIALDENNADSHLNLAYPLFLANDYDSAWREYDWRFKVKEYDLIQGFTPQVEKWDGTNPAPGEQLILASEQGLGDTLQFMRYVAYLNSTGVAAALCASPKLHGLIRSSGITGEVYDSEQASQVTTGKWLPLLSLPGHLKVRPDHPLVDAPYIKAPSHLVAKWKQKLAAERRPLIGINWQGNPDSETGLQTGRSLRLEQFAPIAHVTGGRLLSLQKGFGSEQLASCSFTHQFVGCQEEISRMWDFEETAAIIANCDLVITSDTAVAHLAAGMGQPTWLLLITMPSWCWGLRGDTSFWYPSMRLFRQRGKGHWQEVMGRVATALEQRFASAEAPQADIKTVTVIPEVLDAEVDNVPGAAAEPARGHHRQAEQWALELTRSGQLREAEIVYRKLIEEGTSNYLVYGQLANICRLQEGREEEAIQLFKQAVSLNPRDLVALCNIGSLFAKQHNLQAAMDFYKQALAINPNNPEMLTNVGNIFLESGDLRASISSYVRAISIDNSYAMAHHHLAHALFLSGDYENGWEEHEWRFLAQRSTQPHAQPQVEPWQGHNLAAGESLLLVSEGGLGDTLHFMRYVHHLNQLGISACLCAQTKLHGLIRSSEITTTLYSPEDINQFTAGKWLPLLSLPRHLKVRPGHPVMNAPYIKAPEALILKWQQKLAPDDKPVIGINWQGNPESSTGLHKWRSLPLARFASVADRLSGSLLSLQKGFGSEQLADCPFRHRFVACQEEISHTWDFVETAAIIANCTLVITSDTAVAHLAAGTGKPTWLLLSTSPDWRWHASGDTSFWYPSMRIFRQQHKDNWQEVMDRVAAAVAQEFGAAAVADDPPDADPVPLPQQPEPPDEPSERKAVQKAQLLKQQGRIKEAEAIYRTLISEATRSHVVFVHLAAICIQSGGRTEEAILLLKQALAIQPDNPEALTSLGHAHKRQGELQSAAVAYRKVLAIDPDRPQILLHLGDVLHAQGELDDAVTAYHKALAIKPDAPDVLNNLGNTCLEKGDLQKAGEFYQKALAIKPDRPGMHNNLGNVFLGQGKLEAAIDSYSKAIALNSNNPSSHFYLSFPLFLSRNYDKAWKEYAWRFRMEGYAPHAQPPIDQWDGNNLPAGERLLLVSEQGLGDTLHFMRYVGHLHSTGIPVALCVQDKLSGLVRSSGITSVIYSQKEADQLTTGKWLPLLSLPGYLNVRPDHPIINTPYIKTTEQLIAKWERKLATAQRPVIGINWQGNPESETGLHKGRSFLLEQFAPVAENTNGRLLSLQRGTGSEQLAACSFRQQFVGCQDEISAIWDFMETAAMIANCDLVVTSDTVVAHLAAGQGRPTWLLLDQSPDWRWGLKGSTSFWYPSMRIFRQQHKDNWQEVMDRVAAAVAQEFGAAAVADDPPDADPVPLPQQPEPPDEPSERKAVQKAQLLKQQGRIKEAEAIYRTLISEATRSHVVFVHLAAICIQSGGRTEEAILLLKQALAIQPDNPEALTSLGHAHKRQGELQSAAVAYRKVLAIDPDRPQILLHLGDVLHAQGELDDAVTAYHKALAIKPDAPDVLNNLGNTCLEKGDLQKAGEFYQKALAIKPDRPGMHNNLGNVFLGQGKLEAAIDSYSKAIALNSNNPSSHFYLSFPLFLSRNYDKAWKEYAWRFRMEGYAPHAQPPIDQWDGNNLPAGERLLLVSEQGLGDTLHFMRYVGHLHSTGIPVALCVQDKLSGLVRSSGITSVIYSQKEADQLTTGKWLPLLSLPGYLNVRPDHPIINTPYIKTTEQLIAKWERKLATAQRPVIGINWQGNPESETGLHKGRSFLLEQFAPVAENTNGRLLSLQRGTGSEQLAACSFRQQFVGCQDEISAIWDFMETAAMIANCDLVVTSDTVVAHLAAGQGRPTWLLLDQSPDWRWGLKGSTSFWYPSMCIFRQQHKDNWPELMDRVAAAAAETFAVPE